MLDSRIFSVITHPLPTKTNASEWPATLAAKSAQIAQLVEQRIENPRVRGSNPRLGTTSHLPIVVDDYFRLSGQQTHITGKSWTLLFLF